jgi:hypothetical protein
MSLDAYRVARAESGKLKLRATALLADGGPDERFEAACLLHEAARAEARALRILDAPPPTVRLTSAVERCACLIEGLDPPGAALAWGEVLDASRPVPEPTALALRAKIQTKRASQARGWSKALRGAPVFVKTMWSAGGASADRAHRSGLGQETRALLALFPGVAGLWLALSSNEEDDGNLKGAWAAVQHARRLDPEDAQVWARTLFVAARALGRVEAQAYLDQVHARLESAPWDLCLAAAAVELIMARRFGHDPARRARALAATIEGESRPDAPGGARKCFRALHLLLSELLAGRPPTEEILFRAGLGARMAWRAPAARRTATVEEVLLRQIHEAVSARQEAA